MTIDELYYGNLGYFSTDKGTLHDYINCYYKSEFDQKRESNIRLLEIGIINGGSINLWLNWFTNGEIYGIDVTPIEIEGANIYCADAYTQETVSKFEDNFFDYIIDDGPHTLESQISLINLYLPKVKSGGKLIIEDVQDIDWIDSLSNEASKYSTDYKVFDLRENKERWDDIIFEITKK